jgi:hypothetical protein
MLNVFRMYSRMQECRRRREPGAEVPSAEMLKGGVRRNADVAALAGRDGKALTAVVRHYHEQATCLEARLPRLSSRLDGLEEASARVARRRIDATRGDGFTRLAARRVHRWRPTTGNTRNSPPPGD